MPDVFTKEKRSEVMSRIRGQNTSLELKIRKALFRRGFRYKLHEKNLPGKPDLVFPSYSSIIFIHGCFWHGHNCHLFKWPSTRSDFWELKINRNRQVDARNYRRLKEDNWFILTIWECALKGKKRQPLEDVIDSVEHWLLYETKDKQIKGG